MMLCIVAGVVSTRCSGARQIAPTPVAALQIACPADQAAHGVLGSQSISYPAPMTTGGSQPVAATCDPASGSSFRVGTTQVTCTATDAKAVQAACSFNVSVFGVALGVTAYTAFGDSLTEGENALVAQGLLFVDVSNSYPTKLQSLFDGSYPDQGVSVFNRGIGGEPIVKGVYRLKSVLLADKAGALLLMDGENDLDPCGFFGGISSDCAAHIDALGYGIRDAIRIAKDPPASLKYIFVATLPPPGVVAPGARDRRRGAAAISQANARIRAFAGSEGATLVDVYSRFLGHEADYISVDGLHLTPAGNQAIADAFFAAIQGAVPQTPLGRVLR